MRIERLIRILFYILNREKVTTKELASHFDVSKRTILRDIDTLSLSGIPIYSEYGLNGGYSIHRTYKVNDKLIDVDNSKYILLALKMLSSLYSENKVIETYEKVKHIFNSNEKKSVISIDYSVIKENKEVFEYVKVIEKAILNKKIVSFQYTNTKFETKNISIEPIYVCYKWYSWYVIGFNVDTEKIRLYKLVRIRNLKTKKLTFTNKYDIKTIYDNIFNKTKSENTITLLYEFKKDVKVIVEEYFSGNLIKETKDSFICETKIRENNFMLFSILLGLGDKIKIISPKSFKESIKLHLLKTLKNY